MRLGSLTLFLFTCLVSHNALAVIDCSRAKTNADLMICSNRTLASAQEQMAKTFRQALRRGVDQNLLRDTQRSWYANERNACNDVQCLLDAFETRSAELDTY